MRGNNSITLLSAVTTGTSEAVPMQQFKSAGGSCRFATGVNAGSVIFETAPTKTYSGTWSEAFTITFSGTAPNVLTDAVNLAANFIRARVGTTISGGGSPSVTVDLNRNSHPLA